jgi:predicted methyltransferase
MRSIKSKLGPLFLATALAAPLVSPVHAAEGNAGKQPATAGAASADSALQAVLNGSWRSDAHRARDVYRHPAETLAFFKVEPDVTLIEMTPGQGWYAEILAPLLKQRGQYIAAVQAPSSAAPEQREYQQKNRDRLVEKFGADAERFGAAKVVEFDARQPVLGKPDSADRVVTFRNAHNWIQGGVAPAYFKAFFDVLKPGGVLGVVDHRAATGGKPNPGSGYVSEEEVIELATAAGFKLDAKSEVNANPRDTKDYPKGVWTLPPSLRLGDVDKEKYLAIGESDRFTLRFVKPESAKK